MIEEWRSIEGFDGYQVSSLGNVRSFRRGYTKVLKPSRANKAKRAKVTIYLNKIPHYFTVAQLVCTAFHGPCPKGHETAHKNGSAQDDKASNLRWSIHKDNCADRDRHGTTYRGSRHHSATLKENQVAIIKRTYKKAKAAGSTNGVIRKLAKKFNVALWAVERAAYGKTWKHIT